MVQRDPRKTIGQILYFVLIGSMLIITGPKTLRAIEETLPEADKFQAYFGLIAIDGGLLVWLFLFKHNADSGWRRGVALVMTVITLLATIGLTMMDSFLQASAKGLTAANRADLQALSIWVVVAIIGINVIAGVAWEINPSAWVVVPEQGEQPGRSGRPALQTENPAGLEVYKLTSKPAGHGQPAGRIVSAEKVEQLDQQTAHALDQARVVEPVKTKKLPAKNKK